MLNRTGAGGTGATPGPAIAAALALAAGLAVLTACGGAAQGNGGPAAQAPSQGGAPAEATGQHRDGGEMTAFVKPSDEELRKRLTPMQYEVTQKEGTEPAFKNAYWDNHE